MKDVITLTKELFTYFFKEKNLDKILSILSEDITYYDFVSEKTVKGKKQVATFIKQEMCQEMMACEYSIYREELLVKSAESETATVHIVVNADSLVLKCRFLVVTKIEEGEARLGVVQSSFLHDEDMHDLVNQKENANLLSKLVNTVNGGMALYRVEEFDMMTVLYVNDGVGRISGYTTKQYKELYEEDALQSVYVGDRASVLECVKKTIQTNQVHSLNFRILACDGTYMWIEGIYSKFGEDQGRPVIRAVFLPVSMQYELQRQTLNMSDVSVYVIDQKTEELYFANEACFHMHGMTPCNYAGKTCHEVFCGSIERCNQCWLNHKTNHKKSQDVVVTKIPNGRTIAIKTETKRWNHRDILVVYAHDVTEECHLQESLQEFKNAVTIAMQYGKSALWTYDYNTKELVQGFGNDGAYGYDIVEQNIPENYIIRKVVHPDDVDKYRNCYQRIQNGDEKSQCLVRVFEQRQAVYKWMRIYLVKQHETPDQHLRAIGFAVNVDEEVSCQENIRQSKELIQKACDFSGMWTFTYDIKEDVLYCDDTFCKQFGMPRKIHDFPEAMFSYQLILPEYEALYRKSFEKLKNQHEVVNFDIQTHYVDGSIHWIRFRGQMLSESNQQCDMAVISAQVVDTEKAMEARIEMEQKRVQGEEGKLLFSYVSDVTENIVLEARVFDGKDKIDVQNKPMDKCMELGASCVQGRTEQEKYRSIHARNNLLEMFQNGQVQKEIEQELKTPEGKIISCKSVLHLLKNPNTGNILLYEYVYDISTEKIIKELLNVLLNHDYEDYGSLNVSDGRYTRLEFQPNHTAPKAKTVDFVDAMKVYSKENVYPEDQDQYLQGCTLEAVYDAALHNKEFRYRTIEDGKIHYKKSHAYLYNADRQICLLARSDITELVLKEEQEKKKISKALEAAELAASGKSNFLAKMSHDMRTPMNAIIGLTALTLDDAKNPVAVRENMTSMRAASDYMLSLVNDILDTAQLDAGMIKLKQEPYAYQDFIVNMKTMFQPLCDAKGIHLVFAKSKMNPVILTDKMRINQILFNLLFNAVKFTKKGGTITYNVENLQIERDLLQADFVVTDTGIGMSKEYQKHLFEPFMQEDTSIKTELQGSGLGLSITKQLVDLMGGKIQVSSTKDVGTTVTVSLSFTCISIDDKETKAMTGPEEDMRQLAGKKVLLVEDHPLNMQIAKRILEKKNLVVIYAEDGKKAVDIFKASEPGSFDCILMDIRMPEMTGLEATRAIRALHRTDATNIPIIAMSANAYPEDVKKSLAAGMNAHLAKPIDPILLYSKLRECMK